MGADHNIDRAQLNGLYRFGLLLGGAEPGQHIHPQGETRHALGEVGVVLGARTVVGQRTATCRPSLATLNAARIATSVLP